MTLPTIHPPSPLLLIPEPLTPLSFAPFGTIIAPPLPQSLTSYPSPIPQPLHVNHQPQPVPANQATALKTSPISPLINNYPVTEASSEGQPGTGLMSIFSSFPRGNIYLSPSTTGTITPKLKVGILERHPYTTQTFCPFNYSTPHQPSSSPPTPTTTATSLPQTYILIIVAPTLPNLTSTPSNPPDLPRLRAFIHPLASSGLNSPNIAVTYNPGTWHAPMIVLGSQRVDFLVTQFANGVAQDDCQEVLIGTGPDGGVLSGGVRGGRIRGGLEVQGEREVEVEVELGGVEGLEVSDGEAEGEGEGEERWTTDEAVKRAVRASKL